MKCILSWFVILAVIIGGVWFFGAKTAHAPMAPSPANTVVLDTVKDAMVDMIQVTAPLAQSVIKSPLTVSGKARGIWYFEASFPIELQKSDGTVIATTTGQAQGDWMTDNWVPFIATLTFPAQPAGSPGKLVLKKDNPSGEAQNDKSITIPVQF